MGYNTQHTLKTVPESELKRAREAIAEVDGDPFDDACKWYDHEADMRKVSAGMRDVMFIVTGDGEDAGDQWILYALNGEVVKHKRPEWDPPEPPDGWVKSLADVEAKARRKADQERARDLAELARLKAKYGDE
jgi:hypothetical protein